ncbi:MAG: arginyltransferase [Hyphomonadaceae bacterium]
MTRQFQSKPLRFYLTSPQPCPYLDDRKERKVFTGLDGGDALALNEALTHAGFRRSQNIAYRPACEGCDLCISARIPVRRFALGRSWRRVLNRNADLARKRRPPEATEEQFWLLRRYLAARHAEGGMADMGLMDYAAMVEDTAVHTHVVEYRYTEGPEAGELAAAVIVDLLRDGLSLVYSFFDPRAERRSLGVYTILDHVAQAEAVGLDYVYLGYWVPGSDKMSYKARFRPLELLRAGAWTPIEHTGYANQTG